MKVTLPAFSQADVLVIGDVMLDRYWSGPTTRISPEAPVPVVNINDVEERPGGAANVAMNIASLGAQAHIIGLTGKDEAAQILENKLESAKIKCHFEALTTHPTITKLRILSRHQQLLRLDFEEPFYGVATAPIIKKMESILPTTGALILSDYAKGALDAVQVMIKQARQYNVPVLIDPKGTDFKRYTGATLLTPNLSEFEAVVGKCNSDDDIVQRGQQLILDLDLEALLVTRSEQGMTLLQKDKPALHMPTQAHEVYDVTGAGDTVIAIMAAALASGTVLEDACFLANAGAGVVVGKLGTSMVTPVELENAIRGRTETGFGVMSEQDLKQAVSHARARGERIVMTNGCFDILHAGHVSYLANARKLGDRLIVAVNSDNSVKRLKGNSRPINPLDQRMMVLAALESVDWVVEFNEDTPQRLIADVLPDVLVKGGDYKPSEIAGAQEVLAAGGEVNVLNFEDGCSTSNIIKTILTQGR